MLYTDSLSCTQSAFGLDSQQMNNGPFGLRIWSTRRFIYYLQSLCLGLSLASLIMLQQGLPYFTIEI